METEIINTPKLGGFFGACLDTINKIPLQGGSVEEVIAYLVLQRFTQGQGLHAGLLTSAGAQAISKNGGFSYRRSQKALEWLKLHFIDESSAPFIMEPNKVDPTAEIPEYFSKCVMRKTKIQWYLPQAEGKLIFLPNTLFTGIAKGKLPIKKIYDEVSAGVLDGISKSQARLDAIMVLLNLYAYHDIADCGGIDPRGAIYNRWPIAETGLSGRDAKENISGTSLALFEVKQDQPRACPMFINATLGYIEDEVKRRKCFWVAFFNLKNLGLMYEVITVWNQDPTKNITMVSELLFTLYIFDRSARNKEPYLQRDIHKMLISMSQVDAVEILDDGSDTMDDDFLTPAVNSGKFRFLAERDSSACAIGVYRLRFRPNDQDTAIGISLEQQRHEEWLKALNGFEAGYGCN